MDESPRISGAEWEVMHVLWESSPLTAHEVFLALDDSDWTLATVKTLLSRLLKKEALSHTLDGKSYLYAPKVARESCVLSESDTFLHRVFRGATSPALAHFVKRGRLSSREIKELQRLLKDLEKKK